MPLIKYFHALPDPDFNLWTVDIYPEPQRSHDTSPNSELHSQARP